MSPSEAKRIVLISTVGAGMLTTVAAFRKGRGPSLRAATGALIAGTILAAGAELQPDLAAGFALLLVVSAGFAVGGDAFEGIQAATQATSTDQPLVGYGNAVGGAIQTN